MDSRELAYMYIFDYIKSANKTWQKQIILHHSLTKDGQTVEWSGIKRYHTSYRYNYNIISEERAQELIKAGKYVEKPWSDIGYHFGMELVNDRYEYMIGRPLIKWGAHCKDHNTDSIGICVVGNYDISTPTDEQYFKLASLCRPLMEKFDIDILKINPHWSYTSHKTCPGINFSIPRLRQFISG